MTGLKRTPRSRGGFTLVELIVGIGDSGCAGGLCRPGADRVH